ncbi:MAG: ROK family protein [Verrucomicrobia bacterium]|nr:ROK family protein [Verrucomicrobiota bacterium]
MKTSRLAVGVDIGGTKIAVGAVDAAGHIHARAALPTEAEQGFDRTVRRLGDAIARVLDQTDPGGELTGIGIGCTGPVDPARGLINNPFTLGGWNRCDIVSPLGERFGVRVRLENDADAAAFGECFAGAGRGHDPVVMLTFGTGVGGAVIIGGQIYRGAAGEHPELGHLAVAADGPTCYCGIRGCLESLASGTAVGEAGRAAGFADAKAVFAAARVGQPAAREIAARALEATATAAWTLFHTFLPRRLIFGGGVMEQDFDLYAEAARKRLAAATQFTTGVGQIVRASLGNDAGLIGAAGLVLGAAGNAP